MADYLKLLDEGFTRKYLKESEEIEDTSTDEIDVGDLFMNGDETYKLLDVKIDEDGEVVVEAENDETGEPEEIEYISKEEAEELYGEPDAEDEPEAYAESLRRRIKECLRRMNEAQMSDEDRIDSEILRGIYNKRQDRKNAKLTDREISVLNKYDLIDDDQRILNYRNGVSLTRDIPARAYYQGKNKGYKYKIENDKINLADRARKIPQRGNGYLPSKYAQNTLEVERDFLNQNMQEPVNNLKQALEYRNGVRNKLSNIDAYYDDEMAKLLQRKEQDRAQTQKDFDDRQHSVDYMLKVARQKSRDNQRRRNASNSDLDVANESLRRRIRSKRKRNESYLREADGHGYYDEFGNWVGDEFKKNQVERNTANFFDKTWNGQNSQSMKNMRAANQSVGTRYDPDANPNGQKTPSQGQIKQSQRDVNARANYYDYQNSRNKSSGYDPDANPNGQKTKMGQGDINQRKNGFTPQNTQQQSQPVKQQTQQSSGNYNPQQNAQPQQPQPQQTQQPQPQQTQQQQQPQGPGAGSPNYNDGQTRVIGLDQTQGMGKYKTPRSK